MAWERFGKIVAYSLFVWAIWLFIGLGVLLDYVNVLPHGSEVTLFGITGTKSEWQQNLFLVGIFSVMVPISLITGFIGGHYNLKSYHVIIVIITALAIGSALWDLVYMHLYPLPANEFYWWFDPFLAIVNIYNVTSLNVFKIEGGVVLMDAEFMRFFSYLRLLIFVPALLFEIWRFSK